MFNMKLSIPNYTESSIIASNQIRFTIMLLLVIFIKDYFKKTSKYLNINRDIQFLSPTTTTTTTTTTNA
jgi:hypothetical protein